MHDIVTSTHANRLRHLPRKNISAQQAAPAAQRIRITVNTDNLNNASTYCTKVGQSIPTLLNDPPFVCTEDDILTPVKKQLIRDKFLKNAVKFVSDALSVIPVQDKLLVPSPCLSWGFNIPSADAAVGLENTDFHIYLVTVPVNYTLQRAWGLLCSFDSEGRPTSGIINVNPRQVPVNQTGLEIENQFMRSIAHEIIHILGFLQPAWQYSKRAECFVQNETRRGMVVDTLRGPQTVKIARNQFACPDMTGPELEGRISNRISSHLKARFHLDDIMSDVLSSSMRLTPLTLSVLQDLGHYQINWDKAELPFWMRGIGCDALFQQCNYGPSAGEGKYFCFDRLSSGCAPERLSVGTCSIITYTNSLPPTMQYFDDAFVGGTNKGLEFCPNYVGFSEGNCLTGNSSISGIVPAAELGYFFGNNSRCYVTPKHVLRSNVVYSDRVLLGRCFDTRCFFRDGELRSSFRVGNMSRWVNCTVPGQELSLEELGYFGSVICPDPWEICTLNLHPGTGDKKIQELPISKEPPTGMTDRPARNCPDPIEIPFTIAKKREAGFANIIISTTLLFIIASWIIL